MSEAFTPPPTTHGHEVEALDVPVIQLYPEAGKIRVLDAVLDVLPQPDDAKAARFIPSWEAMKGSVCWDGPTVQLIRDMAIRLSGDIPSRSEGPTGVSKSFAVEVLAAMTNRSFLRHNYSKDSDPGDTIGRFVPSDQKLAVRFEELLADSDLSPDNMELVVKAKAENRSLTMYESKKIAAQLGIGELEEDTQWRWHNGTLAGAMMYGSVYGADEPNLAPGNVVERENSILEKRPKLRIVEHDGEIIRQLTPEEQSIIDCGGNVPGVIGLDTAFWYVAAQNPYGIGGGRIEESEARRNRLQDRIVEALTAKEYEEYLRFLILGEQPDVTWHNKTYKGERDVQTPHRDLEEIPNVEIVLTWLAQFQTDLQNLADRGQIGSEKDIRGGSYVYSRRNIERFLDTLKGAQGALLDTRELFAEGTLSANTNWHDLFMEALRQEYLAGMYREDAETVQDLIKASGVTDRLGASANNPVMPNWVDKAQNEGINVEEKAGEWILRKAGVELEEIMVVAAEDGFVAQESEDTISLQRPLRGVLELFVDKNSAEPTNASNQQHTIREEQ